MKADRVLAGADLNRPRAATSCARRTPSRGLEPAPSEPQLAETRQPARE